MTTIATRDAILHLGRPKIVKVEVPEWDCTVCVRPMNGFRRQEYERAAIDRAENFHGIIAASLLCDEAGEYLFDFTNEDDVNHLMELHWFGLNRVVEAGLKVSLPSPEEARKN